MLLTKCSTCEYGRTEQCTFPLICYGGRSWKSRSESLKIKVEEETMDMDKTCDSCEYGDDYECFQAVGHCEDYSKWEPVSEVKEEEPVGEDLLTIIRDTLTPTEFQGYCLGKYLEATYYEG